MSLLDELNTEKADPRNLPQSKINIFIETLSAKDRAQFSEWLRNPTDKAAMWRVLRRRGLPAAEPTFRAWVAKSCR